MRPGNAAIFVVPTARVDQHVEAVDVQQIAAYFDAEDGRIRVQREFIAPVPGLQRRQVFSGHPWHGELHGHTALALANALDLKLSQVPAHERYHDIVSAILSQAK